MPFVLVMWVFMVASSRIMGDEYAPAESQDARSEDFIGEVQDWINEVNDWAEEDRSLAKQDYAREGSGDFVQQEPTAAEPSLMGQIIDFVNRNTGAVALAVATSPLFIAQFINFWNGFALKRRADYYLGYFKHQFKNLQYKIQQTRRNLYRYFLWG